MINKILEKSNMTIYELSKKSGIPYTTLLELSKNITSIEYCNVKTAYKLAKALDITIEDLLDVEEDNDLPFEEFRSNLCHELKDKGYKKLLYDVYYENRVIRYYNKKQYDRAYYTLALVDYLSKKNNIPIAKEYDKLRNKKLNKMIYPRDINMVSNLINDKSYKTKASEDAINEFKKYNIIEKDIYNVC